MSDKVKTLRDRQRWRVDFNLDFSIGYCIIKGNGLQASCSLTIRDREKMRAKWIFSLPMRD